MFSSILVSTVFATCLCFAHGQITCNTPNTQCKSILDCQPLLDIANNPSRSQQDTDYLKSQHCGYDGTSHAVCCPKPIANVAVGSCTTPEGYTGSCIDINTCEHLIPLLTPPVSQQTITYLRSLRCPGADQFSVCCGKKPNVDIKPNSFQNPCQASLTAFPPDPASGCCGMDSRVGDKIFGGIDAAIDQYPWLALIEYTKGNVVKTMCGGSLISNKYVLTAGHCVAGRILTLGTPDSVRLGEYDASHEGPDCVAVVGGGTDCTTGAMRIKIERTLPHPEYDPTEPLRRNDIALIRLREIAPFTDFIRPICLPSSDLTISPPLNFTLYAAGWGAVSDQQAKSNIKQHVDLPFVSQAQCQPLYKPYNVDLWNRQLCAGGEKGKDSCKGDSGGPLMYENGRAYEEIGVVSYGALYCGTENFPAIYTKVFEYIGWIRSNIRP